MKRFLLLPALAALLTACAPQLNVSEKSSPSSFEIAAQGEAARIFVSPAENIAVKTAAGLFAGDVERVTGIAAEVTETDEITGGNVIIAGTPEGNPFIRSLCEKGVLDAEALEKGWERHQIKIVKDPAEGVKKALVVAGSDRRGVAYGLFSISKKMGVSPWYWWADVPVQKRAAAYLSGGEISNAPAVRYRGFFINDEDWGLKPWSTINFEKDLGDIGPKTYEKVCELLLRLGGNMLAPAMHSCTGAFYSHPESKVAADRYGIIITTSHCEPLLLNNAAKSEWDSETDGDWNYVTNAQTIRDKWNARLDEASAYENIYTVAMRGLHDAGLRGDLKPEEKVKVLGQVIRDQREMLVEHTGKDIRDIPQIFVPYKETMDVYEDGLEVPDDVTLVWVDDNYGYMKRVADDEEMKRAGRGGVYYHVSYLGGPHDYLWLCTTSPALMYEELSKAYRHGADRYWLLNVGDIKPAELAIDTFFDLAWNTEEFDYDKVNSHQAKFLAGIFGTKYENDFQNILDEYYRLAWSRKPEYMGWEREWDTKEYTGLKDTEFSFTNYDEAQRRLADYEAICAKVNSIAAQLDEGNKAAFFELLEYPVNAAYRMNRKFLLAQLSHEMAAAGELAKANWAAAQAREAYDDVNALNDAYNSMLDGKWNGMMALAPGWCALYQNMPELTVFEGAGEEPVDLTPVPQEPAEGYIVLDLESFNRKGSSAQIIEGLGYDWKVLRLGAAAFELPAIDADEVELVLYSVPFFPLNKNFGTRIGVSLDGNEQIFDNAFSEYSLSWKNQVLRNAAEGRFKFKIDRNAPKHTLTLTGIDPDMMVEKVIIDCGGLKKSYLGPEL